MGQVQTARGKVDADDLGVTLHHEHLILDSVQALWSNPQDSFKRQFVDQPVQMSNLGVIRRSPGICKDNLVLDDIELAISEVNEFKNMGGKTLVEVTTRGIGPNPDAIMRISERTGLNIIACTGYYTAKSHPASVRAKTAEELRDEMIKDITVGINGSRVKAGIIGELGMSIKIAPEEVKVLRAAAGAHLETGCPILVHLSPTSRDGFKVLDILEDEGASPAKVDLGHLDTDTDLEYHKKLAERGCFVSYDQFGLEYEDCEVNVFGGETRSISWPSDPQKADLVAEMRKIGLLNNLMISQDVAEKIDLKHYGGHGYDHILRNIVPMLRKRGVTDSEIETLLVQNPKRFLMPGTG